MFLRLWLLLSLPLRFERWVLFCCCFLEVPEVQLNLSNLRFQYHNASAQSKIWITEKSSTTVLIWLFACLILMMLKDSFAIRETEIAFKVQNVTVDWFVKAEQTREEMRPNTIEAMGSYPFQPFRVVSEFLIACVAFGLRTGNMFTPPTYEQGPASRPKLFPLFTSILSSKTC